MKLRRLPLVLGAAALLLFAGEPTSAQGTSAGVTVSAAVEGGYLNLSRVGGSSDVVFPSTEILPTTQTINATQGPQFIVTDATGTRAGWHMTLQCSNFTAGNNSINASNVLFDGNSGSLSDDDFVLINGDAPNTSSGPEDWTSSAQSLNTAKKIVYASAGWGAGSYTWTPTPSKFRITIPPTTKGGSTTYTATYTLTLLTGP